MKTMKYQGAIFDQDGLLFDTEKIYQASWIASAKEQGVDMPVSFPHQFCGKSPAMIGEISRRAYPSLDIKRFCDRAISCAWEFQLKTTPEKKPGLVEMLSFCRANGIKTAVASSSTIKVIEHNLTAAGVRECFDAIACADEVVHGKPAPDIFLLAASKIGIEPSRCVVFEDAFSGIQGANAAGMGAVMIPDVVAPTDEIREICRVYPTLADATDVFTL